MDDEFLKSCLLLNIEKEIVASFSTDKIIDNFYSVKQRRAQLKMHRVWFVTVINFNICLINIYLVYMSKFLINVLFTTDYSIRKWIGNVHDHWKVHVLV